MKRWKLCAAACAAAVIVGGCIWLYQESQPAYTYEQLCAMPADQLLDTFVDNGLVINDRLLETFTEEELAEMFKQEFDGLRQGVIIRSDMMYWDLAKQTKEVYDRITQ